MTDSMIEINDASFSTAICSGIVLVGFGAPWCHSCCQQRPIMDEVAVRMMPRGMIVARVNTDLCPRTTKLFNIKEFPTLLIFRDGQLIIRLTGFHSTQRLVEELERAAKFRSESSGTAVDDDYGGG